MLTALEACAALTALIAGIAGAWSPCGLSMIDTIGSLLGGTRRAILWIALAGFTLGALLGGVVTFGGLAALGSLVGHGGETLRDALGAALALAAAIADWRGLRIAPQIRRQVPERWRWIMPLPLASTLYGVLLGLGFTTFVLAFAVWALAALSLAAGNITLGLIVGAAFGAGRVLPIALMAPTLQAEMGQRRLRSIAVEPRLWLGTRRLAALALVACAAALGSTPAFAHTSSAATTTVATAATDPTSNGTQLAWQQVGGMGMIENPGGVPAPLPGSLPALGGGNVAWSDGATIVVADATTLVPELSVPVPTGFSVGTLAVSDDWLVVNLLGSGSTGGELLAYQLADPATGKTIATAALAGEIGRPALDGSDLAYAIGGTNLSRIDEVDLDDGTTTVLRSTGANYSLANPSLAGDDLLYEQIGRCAQELLIGTTAAKSKNTLLLSLPSTVTRDNGYQPGYVRNYDHASHCPNRPAGPGGKITLGTTALTSSTAYVTEYPREVKGAEIVSLASGG